MRVDPNSAGFCDQRLERISEHLERNYIAPGKIPGCQVSVGRRGHLAYHRSFGFADKEREVPVDDGTIFRIYSMSKPITSIALMMLFEEGRLQLTDPVYKFIPSWKGQQVWVKGEGENMELRSPIEPVSIAHLLTHMSGLTYGEYLFPSDHPVDKLYGSIRDDKKSLVSFADELALIPLRFDPGTRWCYSLSTDVCGALVEIISGQPFSEFLRERIFEPLEMYDTAFTISNDKVPRFAANYERDENKNLILIDDPVESVYSDSGRLQSGGGGLLSSTADYSKFCEMLLAGGKYLGCRIIGHRTLKMMCQNHLPKNADLASVAMGSFSETAYEGVGFGLGFAQTLSEVRTQNIGAGDFYWGGMASTIFWVDPKESMYCVFMTQLIPSTTFNIRGQLKALVYSSIED